MASELDFPELVLLHGEFSHDPFSVRHAFRVEALHNAFNAFWNLNGMFVYDLKIFDFNKSCCWRDKSYLVDFLRFEEFVGYFYDAFGAVFLAFEVGPEIYRAVAFFKS